MSQHMEALAKANAIRLARAGVRHQLRDGEITLAEALDAPEVQSMRVEELLCAQYRWGPVVALKALRRAEIPPVSMVWQMTARQREVLCAGEKPAAMVAAPERDATRGHVRTGKTCRGCDIYLAEWTDLMLCGFCIEEQEAA